ncbi:MAG: hypothetical protein ACTSP4_14600 [Candidatus Hodarchaeales archaeon]
MLNRSHEKQIIEEEDEEFDITLQMDIISALKSLESVAENKEDEPRVKPFQPATTMSITKDLWEIFDQSSQYKIGSNEFNHLKKKESNLVVTDQKLPRECSFDELLDQAIGELSSITDSIK